MSRPPARTRVALLLLAAVCVTTRLPLLGHGYGSDPDAWRNAVAALRMHEAGRYVPSRAPGFPVYEALLAALIPLGPAATNAASVLAQLAGAWCIWRIGLALGLAAPLSLAAGYLLSPALWVDATQTMDYAFGMAAVLAAYLALLRGRHGWAGVALALATGCRASHALMLAPALLFVIRGRRGARAAAAVTAGFAATTAAIFVPTLSAFGGGDLGGQLAAHVGRHALPLAHVPIALRTGVAFLFGKLGAIVLAVGCVAGWLGLRRGGARGTAGSSPGTGANPNVARASARGSATILPAAAIGFEIVAMVVIALSFALIPYEAAYLLPALPFGLLLAGRLLTSGWMFAVALAMGTEALTLPLLGTRELAPGRLAIEVTRRRGALAETRALIGEREAPAGGAAAREVVLIDRFALQRLLVLDRSLERTEAGWAPFEASGVGLWSQGRRVGYAVTLDAGERAMLEAEGYAIREVPRQR